MIKLRLGKNNTWKKLMAGVFMTSMALLMACGKKEPVESFDDKDFSSYKSPGAMEAAYEYQNFFLPGKDKLSQPYVGDTMPYYEDGTYYIYYLKDGGDSYNHSVYLATTTDFKT